MSPDPLERIRQFKERHNTAPGHVIIAADKPMALNQVFVVAGLRYAVDQQLSEDEFRKRMADNERVRRKQEAEMGISPAESAQGSFQSKGPGVMTEAKFADAPSPHHRYFYAMRRV